MAPRTKRTVTGRTPSEPPLQNVPPERTPEQERQLLIMRSKFFWGGFYRCPTTGTIREVMAGDDKVLCNCGRSNPKVPQERTELTGVHNIRFLEPATAEEYVDEKLKAGWWKPASSAE